MKVTVDFLKRNFIKYNNLIFKGVLPIIPIKVGSSTKTGGNFKSHVNRYTRDLIDPQITISGVFDKTEKEFINVLVHEMLHYFVAFKKLRDTSSHGVIWTRLANEISAKYNLNITQYESIENLGKLSSNSNKTARMIEFMYKGKKRVAKISKNFDIKNLNNFNGVEFIKEYISIKPEDIVMPTSVKNLRFKTI